MAERRIWRRSFLGARLVAGTRWRRIVHSWVRSIGEGRVSTAVDVREVDPLSAGCAIVGAAIADVECSAGVAVFAAGADAAVYLISSASFS